VTAHYLTLAGLPPPSPSDPTGATTNTTPLPLARLLGLATQKFIADIAADAYQYSRIRAGGTSNSLATAAMGGAAPAGGAGGGGGGAGGGAGGGKGGQSTGLGVQRAGFGGGGAGGTKAVLTMEDLGMAVQEYGVNVKRSEFYR
jgi:transcription initiation factor TFIID subunit 10